MFFTFSIVLVNDGNCAALGFGSGVDLFPPFCLFLVFRFLDFSTFWSNYSDSHLVCMKHLMAGTGNLKKLNLRATVNLVGSWPGFIM